VKAGDVSDVGVTDSLVGAVGELEVVSGLEVNGTGGWCSWGGSMLSTEFEREWLRWWSGVVQ
jgi:hypothetical protein